MEEESTPTTASPPQPPIWLYRTGAKLIEKLKARRKPCNAMLRKVKFPKRVTPSRTEDVKLVFNSSVNYAKVALTLNNPAIQIYYHNKLVKQPVFEFHFKPEQKKRVEVLGIKLVRLKEGTDQPLKLDCFDANGEMVPSVEIKTKLRNRAPFPAGPLKSFDIVPWLIDQSLYIRWYVKYPIILALLVLMATLAPLFIPERYRKAGIYYAEESMIALHLWPQRIREWQDEMKRGPNGDWLKRNEWDYPSSAWSFEEERVNPDDPSEVRRFVRIDGRSEGTRKTTSGEAFYDFALHFRVRLLETDRVEWVLREHDENRYGFVLQQANNNLYLTGYSYSPSEGTVTLEGSNVSIDVADCCRTKDEFEIKVLVKNFEFHYWIAIQNPNDQPPPRVLNQFYPLDQKGFVLKDKRRWFLGKFRWGNVGFMGTDGRGKALLYYWLITPLEDEDPEAVASFQKD